jgi:hypothetical protein
MPRCSPWSGGGDRAWSLLTDLRCLGTENTSTRAGARRVERGDSNSAMTIHLRVPHAWLALPVIALAISACGSSSSTPSSAAATAKQSPSTPAAATSTSSASTASTVGLPPAVNELPAAEHPSTGQFPAARGRSLQQLGALVKATAQLGSATGTFTPGTRRLAFGLTTHSGAFIYAPTAVYIAKTPNSPAKGPFLAPADPMSVQPQYRSKQNSGPGGIKAIYAAQLPIPSAGTFTVLSLTKTSKGFVGSPGEVAATRRSPIPNVGQRPPDIATDTPATVGGNFSLLTTRQPPEQMHSVSFNKVLGKRPIALLFSTPQFCISRVCGPVTDVAVQLQHQFANKITFIHEEVYVDNQPSKGLRPQLRAFHLRTEPWLFTINRKGIITARLEGAFGTTELAQALKAALQ